MNHQPVASTTPPATVREPQRRPRAVLRERLIRRLWEECDVPVVLLVAPAGYGKTTLLSQWARQDSRPFAVLVVREADNDPRHLLESVARALCGVVTIDDEVFVGLLTPGGSVVPDVLEWLERSLVGSEPFVLVLDGVGVLKSAESLIVLAALAERVPAGSQLALASRSEPGLPIGRLRAERRVLELRAADLAMTRREAAALVDAGGVELAPEDVVALVRRTEGWPAGLSLAALALRDEPDAGRVIRRFRGGSRVVADYVRHELLATLGRDEIRFLMRASILDVLSGPVCDAVLGCSGSGALLRELARTNVLLVALDQSDDEYRCHVLFAEMLCAELRREDPERERELQRRATAWYAERGDLDRAVDHAVAANDQAAAGRLLWARAAPDVLSGRTLSLRSWLERFSVDEVAANPGLALSAAAGHLVAGERDLVEHWVAAAERALRSDETVGPDRRELVAGAAVMRAVVARNGLREMADDAERGCALAGEASPWRTLGCLLAGVSAQLRLQRESARAHLQEGARRGAVCAPLIQVLCLAQLALLAIDEEDWSDAEALSARARSQVDRVGLGDCPLSALVFAVSALVRAQRGRTEQAQGDRRASLTLLARLTDFVPWYTGEARTVLADAALRLGDVGGARPLLAEASRSVRELPEAAGLSGRIEQSAAAAETLAQSVPGPASLTTAEVRVLQLLPTHLSFREMAAGLHVSANTVKTHAHAVYRKLDACSRSEAVVRAREAGLLVDSLDEFPPPPSSAGDDAHPDSLTMVELRVLRLLPSELSFAEMGSRLRLSAATVKTHADAAYRKLAACSRSEAVERARAVGLLAAPVGR